MPTKSTQKILTRVDGKPLTDEDLGRLRKHYLKIVERSSPASVVVSGDPADITKATTKSSGLKTDVPRVHSPR